MASSLTPELAQAMMAAIAQAQSGDPKNNWANVDTQLKHEGKEIVLPAEPGDMPIPVAIDTLKRIEEQENQKFDVSETVPGAPWDALVALYRAMQEIYGVVLAESTKTFFGEIKPDFITVNTGPGKKDKIQVPMGQMRLPGVSEPVQISMFGKGAYIRGTVRRRDQSILIQIATRARELVREQSVYRGRAIRIGVYGPDPTQLDMSRQPEFLDLATVTEADMIHTAETEAMIRTNIFAPLKHTAACRLNHIPLKRGILLEGRYGTGKSLTARVTAKVATDNGWTFLMLDRAQGLGAAIEFARNYQPCVIFAEDIDRAADREDESVNDLVNLIDGVISKDMEIEVVLTTNFIDKIDRALLRPGRFDAVISIQPPDAATAERLIRAYARDLLPEEVDLTRVGEVLNGQIPATIREVVERAKLSMLMEERRFLTADDLFISATGMKRHMELLEPPPAEKTDAQKLWDALSGMVSSSAPGIEIEGTPLEDTLDDLVGQIGATSDRLLKAATKTKEAADAAAGASTRTADRVDSLAKVVEAKRA